MLGTKNHYFLNTGIIFLVLFIFPILDVNAVIQAVDLGDEIHNSWTLFGEEIDKQTALSDDDESTGINSGFNNQKQSFLVDVPLNPGASVPTVTLYAEWTKGLQDNGEEFSGTSKFSFFISSGTSQFIETRAFSATSSLQQGEIVYSINPLTGQSWTSSDFDTTSFGVIQATNDKPILISQFEVRLEIDTEPPVITVPSDFVNVQGNVSNGAQVSFEVTATDNVSSPKNITLSCKPDASIQSSPFIGNNVFFAHNSINPTITEVVCTAEDEAKNTTTASFSVSVIDTIAPDVSLLGDNPDLQLKQKFNLDCPAYDDSGAVASDIVDKVPLLTIQNRVDLCSVDLYTNEYTGTDSTGNHKTIQRDINVIDFFVGSNQPTIDFVTDPYITLLNIGASGTGNQEILLTSTSNPTGIIITLMEDFTEDNVATGIFFSDPVLFAGEINSNIQTLLVREGDEIFGTFDNKITKKLATINFLNSPQAGKAGAQPNQNDPIRFFESDVYYFGQSATVIVEQITRSNTIPVTITSSVDSITIDATKIPRTNTFITNSYITFTEQEDISENVLVVNGASDTVIATTPGLQDQAIANIITDTEIILGPGFTVQTSDKVDCVTSDADADAVCNAWEDDTDSFDGLKIVTNEGRIYELSCDPSATYDTDPTGATVCPDPNVKDLYIELDYMKFHKPNSQAIEQFVQAFRNSNALGTGGSIRGINPHVIVDDEIPHSDFIGWGRSTPDSPDFFALKANFFGTLSERTGTSEEIDDRLNAKRQVFRYGIFAHNQLDIPSSGIGEIAGNDFAITLGDFTAHVGSTSQQASTMLHEVGHTLGLRHGGPDNVFTTDDEINCKPNYPSVMNYLYQFEEGDGGLLANRPLDFSKSAYSIINEQRLYDSQRITGIPALQYVIGGIGIDSDGNPIIPKIVDNGQPINWNRNNIETSAYEFNVNQFEDIPGCDTNDGISLLGSYKDWTALKFNFRDQATWDNGLIKIASPNEPITMPSVFGVEDVAPIVNAGDDPQPLTVGQKWSPPLIEIEEPHASFLSIQVDWGDGSDVTEIMVNINEDNSEIKFDDHQWDQVGEFTLTVIVKNEFFDLCKSNCFGIDTINVIVQPPKYDDVLVDSPLINSQYQENRSIPLKFTIIDNGVKIETPTLPYVTLSYDEDKKVVFDASSKNTEGNNAKFNPADNSYSYSIDTKGLNKGRLFIIINTDDDQTWTTEINIK